MPDAHEIEALKASVRGALATADSLAGLKDSIEGLDPRAELGAADLEEMARVTLAHAVASQALRGLIQTMLARRGAPAA
jgi:hypothetical protein